ncbi:MAG: gamma-glutamylcyclotransferase [Granulosicoccus sp.]|nr:gamma-glutamylcyclotransferase [Granulosicoccus sp.]
MNTDWILYFGYGSLVNRETRPSAEVAHPARLKGWQRVWEHRVTDPNRDRPCTSLSIEPVQPAAGCATVTGHERPGIDGVVVALEAHLLPQLDAREAGYERLSLPLSDFELPADLVLDMQRHYAGDSIMVYRSLPVNRALATPDHPVLQSYIDCVMDGYLQRYGETGVQALIDSTRGWECAVCDDRAEPFYPRWVPVDSDRQRYFDLCVDEYLSRPGRRRQA